MKINRREFLKNLSVGMVGLATVERSSLDLVFPKQFLGRVTNESISVHKEPDDKSGILFQRYRDEILNIYKETISSQGPGYNPVWYRVWGGYIHSGYVQKVDYHLNPLLETFPSQGLLMEVSVPYSQSYRLRANGIWEKFYRLYYSSAHWVFGVEEGPDGAPWYEIRDGLVSLAYYVPAEHLRPISDDELQPINPDVDPRLKEIEISIDFQRLSAYENNELIKEFSISSGVPQMNSDPNLIPTDTPRGRFKVEAKRPSVHMGDGTLRSDAEAYELPGVPWVTYFESSTGVAIHGTYWHNNFGMTMSHGCINMRSNDAKWIYLWSIVPESDNNINYRTPVIVS